MDSIFSSPLCHNLIDRAHCFTGVFGTKIPPKGHVWNAATGRPYQKNSSLTATMGACLDWHQHFESTTIFRSLGSAFTPMH